MTSQELEAVIDAQLAVDLGLEPSVWDRGGVTVVPWRELPGRRRYWEGHPFFLGHIRRDTAAFAVHPDLLPWAREVLPGLEPEWCLDYGGLRTMDQALRPFGWGICKAHPFFSPDLSLPRTAPKGDLAWYEGADLEQFRGDPRWAGTLAFQPALPDMLAVAALDGSGAPVGMAGASRDGARLWQIGVNILPGYRGQGLAVRLTALLKDALLDRGVVPFYGTALSHTASLNVARRAGFRPAWAEVWARPLDRLNDSL